MCVCVCVCARVRARVCMCVFLVVRSCPTLCDPMDYSPLGSSVQGISQAILEWVAISSSRGSPQPRDQTCISCIAGRFFIFHCGSPQPYVEIHRKGLGLPPRQAWGPLQMEACPPQGPELPKWPKSSVLFQQTCCRLISALLGESNIPKTSKSSL